jgi:ketosteroid isomerase-like protein
MIRALIIVAVVALAGCASGGSKAKTFAEVDAQRKAYQADVDKAAALAWKRIESERSAEADLFRADLEFDEDAAKRGAQKAFSERFLPDGKLFVPRAPIAVGPADVARIYEGDSSVLRWAPVEATANGDLGVTWGIAVWSGTDDKGVPWVRQNRYITVWKKDGQGAWKIWADAGIPGPPTPYLR